MLINKYEIISKISNGEFGAVKKIKYNDKLYALKCGAKELIKYEIEIYKQLKSCSNISRIYDVFEDNNIMYMVLDLYVMTLLDYKLINYYHENYIERITTFTKSLLLIIKAIHEINIIHRDLKPTNICLDSNNNIFIIDFGISKIYRHNGLHNSEAKIKGLIGSINFSSLNVLNLIEPSRRDDVESIMYILFYLLINKDTYSIYDNLEASKKKDIDILVAFLQDKSNILFSNTSIDYGNIEKVFKYIRRLKYNQAPNYEFIIILLTQTFSIK